MNRLKIVTILGTRPEVIKMAPVIREIGLRPSIFEHTVVATAQHRQMLDQVLEVFGIKPDIDLGLMQQNQDLAEFASKSLLSLSNLFSELKPNAVLVQGDTTTVMTGALAAFYKGVPVGHVEAGLRSFDRRQPFPGRSIAGLRDASPACTLRRPRGLVSISCAKVYPRRPFSSRGTQSSTL